MVTTGGPAYPEPPELTEIEVTIRVAKAVAVAVWFWLDGGTSANLNCPVPLKFTPCTATRPWPLRCWDLGGR